MSEKQQLINLHRRLQKLLEKRALLGTSADPALLLEIEDIEADIDALRWRLVHRHGQPANPADLTRLWQTLSGIEFITTLLKYSRAELNNMARLQEDHLHILLKLCDFWLTTLASSAADNCHVEGKR